MSQTCYSTFCDGFLLKIKGLHGATACTKCSRYDDRKVPDKFLHASELLERKFSRALQQDIVEKRMAAENALLVKQIAKKRSSDINQQIKQALSVKKLHNENFKKKMHLFSQILKQESRDGNDKLVVLQEIREISMTYSNVMRILNSGLANTLKKMEDAGSKEIVKNLKKFVIEAQLVRSEEEVFKLIQEIEDKGNVRLTETMKKLAAAKKVMLSNKEIFQRFASERTMLHKNSMTNSTIDAEYMHTALDEKVRKDNTIQMNATNWLKAVKRD
jgi:rubrerythrin